MWAATWIVGPGFTLGTGALVSPLGTNLQIVPALPVLGIVPTDPPAFAFAVVALPVVAAFILGVAVGPRVVDSGGLVGNRADIGFLSQPLVKLAATAGVAGAVSAGFGGLLASLTSGSLGPGRFQLAGPRSRGGHALVGTRGRTRCVDGVHRCCPEPFRPAGGQIGGRGGCEAGGPDFWQRNKS